MLQHTALPEDVGSEEQQLPVLVTTRVDPLDNTTINLPPEAPARDIPGRSRVEAPQHIVKQTLESGVGNALPAPPHC